MTNLPPNFSTTDPLQGEVIVRADILQSDDGRRVAEQLVKEGTLTQGIFGELYVNLEADTFKALVFYLNTGKLHCSETHLADLLAEATRLSLSGLVELCEEKLSTTQVLRKSNGSNDDQTTTLTGAVGPEVSVSSAMSNVLVANSFAEAETLRAVNNEDGPAQHHAYRTDTGDQQHSATAASASPQAIEALSEPFQGLEMLEENSVSEVAAGQAQGIAVDGPLEETDEQQSQSMAMLTQHEDKDDSSSSAAGSTPSDGSPSTGGSSSSVTSNRSSSTDGSASSVTSIGSTSTDNFSKGSDASGLTCSQAAESCRTGFSTSTRTTSAGERFREAVARRLNSSPAESSSSNVSWATQDKPQSEADDGVDRHQRATDSIESSSATAAALENRRDVVSVSEHGSSEKSEKAHVWRSTGERYKDYFWRRMNASSAEPNTANDTSSTQASEQPEAMIHAVDAGRQEPGTGPTQSTDIVSVIATATATVSDNRRTVARIPGLAEEQQTVEPDQKSYSGERFNSAVARRLNCAAAAESRINGAAGDTQDEPQPSADVSVRPSLPELVRQRCYFYAPTGGRNQLDGVENQVTRSKETHAATPAAATVDSVQSIDTVQGPREEQHPDDPNQAVISVKEVIEHFEAVNVAIGNNGRSAPPAHSAGTQGRPHPPWAGNGIASTRRQRVSSQNAEDSAEVIADSPSVVRERGRPATRMAQRSMPAAASTDANRAVNETANDRRQRAPSGTLITLQSLYGHPWDSDEEQPELPAQGMSANAANVAPVMTTEGHDDFSDDASSDADMDDAQTGVRGPRGIHFTGGARPNPRTEPDRELMW